MEQCKLHCLFACCCLAQSFLLACWLNCSLVALFTCLLEFTCLLVRLFACLLVCLFASLLVFNPVNTSHRFVLYLCLFLFCFVFFFFFFYFLTRWNSLFHTCVILHCLKVNITFLKKTGAHMCISSVTQLLCFIFIYVLFLCFIFVFICWL